MTSVLTRNAVLRARANVLPLLLALAACTVAVYGQQTDSNIIGTVTDPTGAAVPNAQVVAANQDTSVRYETTSDAQGEYRIKDVPVGLYNVTATASGFAPVTTANVRADLNHTAAVNLSLAVGGLNTAVQVTDAPALIDASSSQLQTTYDSRFAVDSPLAGASRAINGSGIYNLSLLGAGVASAGGIGYGTGPSVGGQRPENNGFDIDGVNNNNPYSTGPRIYVSNEAVNEMNVLTNQFDAEFGGASGGLFNVVVKTGTNSVHGALFEYFQNRDLNAVDYSTVVAGSRTNQRYDNNRFGGGIGGPILRNKLFYYGNFEYNPLGFAASPTAPVQAPTAQGISLLNGMGNLSKTNLGVFEKYVPVAPANLANTFTTVNGVQIPLGQLSFASPDYNNAYHGVAAIDYDLSAADQLRGRYIYDKNAGLDFSAMLPVFYQPNPDANKSASISEFHNFSPTLENELRVSYSRNNAETASGNFQFPGLTAFPNLQFDDLGLQLGPDPYTPSGYILNSSELSDNLTKTFGRHTLKVGYSIDDYILSGYFVQNVRGNYDYASLQQYLLDQQPSGSAFGTPGSGTRSVGATNGVPFGYLNNAAFIQDDWRVTSNLTVNLGVRYEYVTVPVGTRAQQYSSIANVPGVISFNSPQSANNEWSPRIGFAYSPGHDGKWSFRGGVSRAYDNTYINLNQNTEPAFYQTSQIVNSAAPVSNFLANGGLSGAVPPQATAAQARAAIASYNWNQTRPYAMTGTVGVERLLGKDYVLEANYVHTKGVHLYNQTWTNFYGRVTPTNYLPTYLTPPGPAQLAGDKLTLGALQSTIVPGGTATFPNNNLAVYGFQNPLISFKPWGNSEYDGLALQLNKRYSNGLSYIAAYTWSHNLDDSTATLASTFLSPRRAQDFQNMSAEWASSALDRRQRFTFSPVYDFRPFRNGSWLMKNIVGNWNFSGTYTFQSPEYATVQNGIDANLNLDPTGDRPIVNPAGAPNTGSKVNGVNAAGQIVPAGSPTIVAYVAANPNARYITAGLGALSNAGRNTYALGRTDNIDAALTKRLQFGERLNFQFGAQVYNLFNHSQFTGGFLSDISPFYPGGNRSVLIPGSPSFGQLSQFFPSNSRQMNLVARFTF